MLEIKCIHCGSKDEYPLSNLPQICTNCERQMEIQCPTCDKVLPYNYIKCSYCSTPIGRKFDEGKTQWSLLPFDAVACIVKIMEFGAKKYDVDNWRSVEPPIRYIDACFRHLSAWVDGEANDQETGFSHLWHAGCNIVFAIWLELKEKLKCPR